MKKILAIMLLSTLASAQVFPGWEVVGFGCGGVAGIPPDLLPATTGWLGEEYQIDSITNAQCNNSTGFQIIRVSQPFAEVCICPMPLPFAPTCFTYFDPWITQTAFNSAVRWGFWIPLDPALNGMTLLWQAIHIRVPCTGDDEYLTTRAIEQTYALQDI